MKRIFSIILSLLVYTSAAIASTGGNYAPQYATQAEAQAGTATNKIMNPARAKDAVQTYALQAAGIYIGYQHCSDYTLITTSGSIPIDDTIPQSSEGGQVITCSYTAKITGSILEVVFQGNLSASGVETACAMFLDSGVNADEAITQVGPSTADTNPITVYHQYTAADTAAHTYKIRCGQNGAGSVLFNGYTAARKMGGAMGIHLIIREIKQ